MVELLVELLLVELLVELVPADLLFLFLLLLLLFLSSKATEPDREMLQLHIHTLTLLPFSSICWGWGGLLSSVAPQPGPAALTPGGQRSADHSAIATTTHQTARGGHQEEPALISGK
ncbi:unnamed protein product [Pleuronectes platessa]|uniref:Uncharacterized protein n=1 Tax=Pleuronectes platessa TaxID=8262 RepID=A0A9N7V7V2_PLEPL|nr:unnamed protein product [Pleuronectes platessa]